MPRRLVTSAVTLALVCGSVAVAAPATAAGTDLYVNRSKASCLDTGPGTEIQPFCTIQAAANVVLPGQTVHISIGQYDPVTITRSGTPDAPITFVGAPSGTFIGLSNQGVFSSRAVTVTGAHDVVLSKLRTYATDNAVVVDHASHVTIDSNYISGSAVAPNAKPGKGVDLVSGSDAITISRNNILNWGTAGVAVEAGVTNTTITTNLVRYNFAPGIVATDAPGTVVTSNTVINNCVNGITLAGASTGAVVENNLVHNNHQVLDGQANCGANDTTGELVVAAGSTEHTVVDHNLVHTTESDVLYSWGSAKYSSSAAFAAASGQGAHDIDVDPKLGLGDDPTLTERSPAIDAADPAAPGELATDQQGRGRADDPLVANAGAGIADLGALEFQDPFQVSRVDVAPKEGPAPLLVAAAATIDNPWRTPVSYAIDFGDGSAPVTAGTPSALHTYTKAFKPIPDGDPGYRVTVTATLAGGTQRSAFTWAFVNEPGPAVAKLRVRQVGLLLVGVDSFGTTDPWQISEYDYDFGDGSPVVRNPEEYFWHTYPAPGPYTVTLTIHDIGGGTASTTQRVSVAGAFLPVGSRRLLDTRDGSGPIGVGHPMAVPVAGVQGVPADGVTAVVVNVTAMNGTKDSFLSVLPSGGRIPATSTVSFTAGQTVADLVTVPVGPDGKIVVANRAGDADVIVDVQGYYQSSPEEPYGTFLAIVQPQRVADTRDGTGGVPQGPIGHDWPLDVSFHDRAPDLAGSVVLNVTVTDPTEDGSLTVYSADRDAPTAAAPNLYYRAGQTVSNQVIVPLPGTKTVAFRNSAGTAHITVDVQGYYLGSPDGGAGTASFTPVALSRLLDTRTHGTPVGPNGTLGLAVAGVGPVPAYAKSVVLNVTATNATADSLLTVFPSGDRPATSNLAFGPGRTTQNQVIVPIGPDGKIQFYNQAGRVDVVADIAGYFA